MFPSPSLPLLRSSCLWHFCLRIRAQTKKVMLWVSRDEYLFQMREVGHRMGEIVAEVMGKGTQAMYQDHLNVHTHSTQPSPYTCLSPFLLHTLIQTHMPYIMSIIYHCPIFCNASSPWLAQSPVFLQLAIEYLSFLQQAFTGWNYLKIQWVAFKVVSSLSLRSW